MNENSWPQPVHRTPEHWKSYAASAPPALSRAILFLLESDPDILEAVDDIDISLIQSWMGMTPAERMDYSLNTAAGIAEARHVSR